MELNWVDINFYIQEKCVFYAQGISVESVTYFDLREVANVRGTFAFDTQCLEQCNCAPAVPEPKTKCDCGYCKRVQRYLQDDVEIPDLIWIELLIIAVPLQARRCPEVSTKLSFPDFVTTAQDDGKVVSLTHRPPLPPGNTPGTHFC